MRTPLSSSLTLQWYCMLIEDSNGYVDEDLTARQNTAAEQMQDISSGEDEEEDLRVRQRTPPKKVQGHFDIVPLVKEYNKYY
ncbi:hypothetical protein BGX27_003908, partial [Mortierella sp. AM989]